MLRGPASLTVAEFFLDMFSLGDPMIRKTVAALVAGIALALAPTAAMAYTPVPSGGSTATLVPGGTATFSFTGFQGGEMVIFTLTGENGAGATLAGTQSLSKEADAEGGVDVTVTLPEDAVGTYTLTAEGQTSGAESSIVIDSGVAADGGSEGASAGDDELSGTGPADNTALIAGAAGLLVVGAGAVLVAARRRTDA